MVEKMTKKEWEFMVKFFKFDTYELDYEHMIIAVEVTKKMQQLKP